MTKSVRHKKLRKQEKSKLKLKAGRKLPKGLNVTDTSFRAKKIVVKEQISADELRSDDAKKLRDVIKQLQHYSSGAREDAAKSLLDLLKRNPDFLVANKGQIGIVIERAGALLLDTDSGVRSGAVKALRVALPAISDETLGPFAPLLSAQLSCAMTHIDPNVQRDSLDLLRIILDSHPKILAHGWSRILPHFLDQLSQSKDGSAQARLLLVRPEAKLTSLQWRRQVLEMLHKFLQAIMVPEEVQQDEIEHVKWEDNGSIVYIPFPSQPLWTGGFIHNQKVESDVPGEADLKTFCTLIIPVMCQAWVEAMQAASEGEEAEDAAHMMLSVVETLLQMCRHAKQLEKAGDAHTLLEWISDTFWADLSQHLIRMFPYAFVQRSKKSKGKKQGMDLGTEVRCFSLNLALIQLCLTLKKPDSRLETYVLECLENGGRKTQDESKALLQALTLILKWPRNQREENPVLKATLKQFDEMNPSKAERSHYFDLFCELILGGQHNMYNGLDHWISSLPCLLLGEMVPKKALQAMRLLGRHSNHTFLAKLKQILPQIIEKLPGVQVEDMGCIQSQMSACEIIYWTPQWDDKSQKALQTVVKSGRLPSHVSDFLRSTLSIRIGWQPELVASSPANFLAFLQG